MKAQGSLEYLLLVGAVLIIAGVAIVILIQSVSTKNTVNYTQCQSAAKQCQFLLLIKSDYNCQTCDVECIDPATNAELFSGAVNYCKQGQPEMIV